MRRPIGLALAFVAFAIAGCGGDDESTTGPTPEAKAYAAKLNAAQASLFHDVRAEASGVQPATEADLAERAERLVAAFEDFSDRLREIRAPAGVNDLHAELLGAGGS